MGRGHFGGGRMKRDPIAAEREYIMKEKREENLFSISLYFIRKAKRGCDFQRRIEFHQLVV